MIKLLTFLLALVGALVIIVLSVDNRGMVEARCSGRFPSPTSCRSTQCS